MSEKVIKKLNEELIANPNNTAIIARLKDNILKKETHEINIAKGALKRSKVQHLEENEKNSKYFLGLEKADNQK